MMTPGGPVDVELLQVESQTTEIRARLQKKKPGFSSSRASSRLSYSGRLFIVQIFVTCLSVCSQDLRPENFLGRSASFLVWMEILKLSSRSAF